MRLRRAYAAAGSWEEGCWQPGNTPRWVADIHDSCALRWAVSFPQLS